MTFRGRLVAGFVIVTLLPLGVLAVGVRREMHTRTLSESERRATDLADVIATDIAELDSDVGAAVARLAGALPDDPRFRAGALRVDTEDRGYVIDYAGGAMGAAGLSMLQIRNDSGRIISSGHFPAEFDRVGSGLPMSLRGEDEPTLVTMRTAAGSLTALARADSVRLAGRIFTVVGGRSVDQDVIDRLARREELRVALRLPTRTIVSRPARGAGERGNSGSGRPGATAAVATGDQPFDRVLRRIPIAYIDATGDSITRGAAELLIGRSTDPSADLRRSIDRWIFATFLLATTAAVLTALWLAGRLSRPMEELAAAAATVDLDRLDVRFATHRDDEVGILSRRLTSMIERLRGSADRLREAERRATVGDIARQVNHDIKNGLAPIRNVVRHLGQVAQEEPAELPAIFTARKGTLESSIAYLETLAQNYARLSPSLAANPTDVAAVIAEVVGNGTRGPVTVRAQITAGLPPARADAVVLRRILENLVGNAVDSLEGRAGQVTVSAERAPAARDAARGEPAPMVRVTVEDTGRGMTESELGRAFDDFFTTKPQGTGLGLSVVRRLVGDLGGALRIETEPGIGTRVQIDLPAAVPAAPGRSQNPAANR